MTEKKRLDSDTASTTERRAMNGSSFDCVWCVLLRFVEDDDGCWFVEETAVGAVVCGAVEDEGQRGKDRTTTMVLSGDVDGGEEGGGPALRHCARETERELEELGFLIGEGWLINPNFRIYLVSISGVLSTIPYTFHMKIHGFVFLP